MDKREPVREYSEDEEGKLLREFDTAVNDSAVTRAEIEQIIEALRKERERIRQERRDVLNKEIQEARRRQAELEEELREGQESIRAEAEEGIEKITAEAREGQEKIDLEGQEEQERIALEEQKEKEENAREAEATKNQLTDELQEAKREIEAKIQRRKDNISKKISEFDKAHEEGVIHKQALTLYKDSKSTVYTAAKTELERCTKKAELAQARVKRLVREIASLEQDLGQVDGLLNKLSNSRIVDEVSKQEDEMWAEYREEISSEQERQEANKESEIDEAMLHKQEIEKGQEFREKRDAEDAVRAGYADGLNPEEETIEPGTHKIPVKPTEPARPNPVQPTAEPKPQGPAKPQQPTGPKPSAPPKPQNPVKPQQPTGQNPNPKPEKWELEGVEFSIEGGMTPIYTAILSNGKEERKVTLAGIAILDTEFDRDEIRKLTERMGIHKAETCYDKSLAMILEQVDSEYGTQGLKEYQELLRDREMVRKYPERYKDYIKINYDFSGLLVKPTAEVKKLQKMAKESEKKNIVTKFKKRPNSLTRLMKRIFTKSLPEEARIKMPRVVTSKDDTRAIDELNAQMVQNVQDIDEMELLRTKVLEQWSDLHREKGFDIEVFIEQNFVEEERMSEEANKYRVMQDEYEAGLEKDPYAAFKKRIQEQAEKGAPPVERKEGKAKEQEAITVDPTDVTILDKDGNEIGG